MSAAALSFASAHVRGLRGILRGAGAKIGSHGSEEAGAGEFSFHAVSGSRFALLPGARLAPAMHAKRQPSVILLDALGTLVALEPPAPRLRAKLAERFGLAVTEEQAAGAIAAEIAYYRAHLDEGRDPASLAVLRGCCAEILRSALPGAAGIEPDQMVEALLASLCFTAFADVEPALHAARARGQRLLVVSNWDVSLHDVLRKLGVEPQLDAILTSAEVGARKPAPVMFERALELVGASAAEAIHVGDSLEEDVAGARAAGVAPVLVRRAGGDPSDPVGDPADPAPDVRTILSLSELTELTLPLRP
jgi:putative hydrolase of the HAD superfamily